MGIEELKRWHWIVVALVVGLALAWIRTSLAPDEQGGKLRGLAPPEFVSHINRLPTSKGYHWIQHLVVYPEVDNKNFVTLQMMEQQPDGKFMYKDYKFTADIPFHVSNIVPAKSKTYTIRDYLAELKQNNPDITYKYAWWMLPAAEYAIWLGGSLIVIGGIWPIVLNLMIGAGFGGPKKAKDTYDLDRFGKSGTGGLVPQPQFAKAGASAADNDRLRQYQESLEQGVAGTGLQMTAGGAAPTATQAGEVKKLTGTAADSPTLGPTEEEDKEYGGEFYPVAKPAHHEDDAAKPTNRSPNGH